MVNKSIIIIVKAYIIGTFAGLFISVCYNFNIRLIPQTYLNSGRKKDGNLYKVYEAIYLFIFKHVLDLLAPGMYYQ